MAFITIDDGVSINTNSIAAIERRGAMRTTIILNSGEKMLTLVPFDSLVNMMNKPSDSERSMKSILENIDKNTQATRL